MKSIVYPSRIEFLNRGTCSSCGNKGNEVIHTNTNHFFGWTTCNKNECNNKIREWYNKTTIKLEYIIEKYGNNLKIKRSNGDFEYGWKPISDSCQETTNGPFWLQIEKVTHNLNKEITYEDLVKWNT